MNEIDFTKITYKDLKKYLVVDEEELKERAENDAQSLIDNFDIEHALEICETNLADCKEANIDDKYWQLIKSYIESYNQTNEK